MFIAMFLSINFELNWIQIFVNFNYAPNVELNFRLVTNYYVIPNISLNVELLNVRSFSVFIVVVVIMIATNIISISTNNTIPTSQPSSSSETVASHHIYVFRGGVMQWVVICQPWVRALSKATVVTLSQTLHRHYLVLVGSRDWFKRHLHKQKDLFTIKLK